MTRTAMATVQGSASACHHTVRVRDTTAARITAAATDGPDIIAAMIAAATGTAADNVATAAIGIAGDGAIVTATATMIVTGDGRVLNRRCARIHPRNVTGMSGGGLAAES